MNEEWRFINCKLQLEFIDIQFGVELCINLPKFGKWHTTYVDVTELVVTIRNVMYNLPDLGRISLLIAWRLIEWCDDFNHIDTINI